MLNENKKAQIEAKFNDREDFCPHFWQKLVKINIFVQKWEPIVDSLYNSHLEIVLKMKKLFKNESFWGRK